METHQQQNHPPNANEVVPINLQDAQADNNLNLAGGGGGGGIGVNSKNISSTTAGNSSNYMCRQSSTRWTPTTDQIRILKELYYNNGIRSPTADQIQRISARLRQYGKIEGKNVFYWFQNHKARERQKKRFTGTNDVHPPAASMNINFAPIPRSSPTANPHHYIYNNNHKHLYPNISPAPAGGISCSSSACSSPAAGVVGVGQIGGCGNYGSLAMEKSFRDCSISRGETQNCGWIGVDPYPPTTYHSFLEKRKPFEHHETLEEDVEDDQEAPEIETLPLFPIHGNDYNPNSNNGFFNINKSSDSSAYYAGSWYRSGDYPTGGSRASLELSLNSYTGWSMDLHN